MKRYTSALIMASAMALYGDTGLISGIVFGDNEPLIGANVYIIGSTQ